MYLSRHPSLYNGLDATVVALYEQFNLLSRIGDYFSSTRLWTESLETLDVSFLREITWIDSALLRCSYGKAAERIAKLAQKDQLRLFTTDQVLLLECIQAYIGIFTHGALRFALKKARDTKKTLGQSTSIDPEIWNHFVEIHLRIMKQVSLYSTFAQDEDYTLPGSSFSANLKTHPESHWSSYFHWFKSLEISHNAFLKITILRLLESVHTIDEIDEGYITVVQGFDSFEGGQEIHVARVIVSIARSRLLSARKRFPEALEQAHSASGQLNSLSQQLGTEIPRQQIELALAFIETDPTADLTTVLNGYDSAADLSRKYEIYSLEDYCLNQRAMKAAERRAYDEIVQRQERLEHVQNMLENDQASRLTTRLGLWRAGDERNRGAMLDWFEAFDKTYPISQKAFDREPVNPEPHHWDNPSSRFREEQIKFMIYQNMNASPEAQAALKTAQKLITFVSPAANMLYGIDPKEEWSFEWVKSGSERLDSIAVLMNRLRITFLRDSLDTVMDKTFSTIFGMPFTVIDAEKRIQVLNLRPTHIFEIILPSQDSKRISQPDFLLRLNAIKSWFSLEQDFNKDASQYILAEVIRQRIFRSSLGGNPLDNMDRDVELYCDHYNSITNENIKQMLFSVFLQVRQQILDFRLRFEADIKKERLKDFQSGYEKLILEYTTSHLAGDFSKIGTIYGKIAETSLRIEPGLAGLTSFQHSLGEAESYFDIIRSELSALGGSLSANLKASIRTGLSGSQILLDRVTDLLVDKYFAASSDKVTQDATACAIWDVVQRNKNRALTDLLSGTNMMPKVLEDKIKNNESVQLWKSKIDQIRKLRSSTDADPTAIDSARRSLAEFEKKALENPETATIFTEILAFTKGDAINISEIHRTIRTVSASPVVLVDWFCANKPTITNKLHIMVLRIDESVKCPIIMELEVGIAGKVQAWLNPSDNPENTEISRAPNPYEKLQTIKGLIAPLEALTMPGEHLVFCPTTVWNIHRVPLHALDLRAGKLPQLSNLGLEDSPTNEEHGTTESSVQPPYLEPSWLRENLALLRNDISYTYSHSILRLSIISRQRQTELPQRSPLKAVAISALTEPENLSEIATESITAFSDLLGCNRLIKHEVTPASTLKSFENSDFALFLGHVRKDSDQDPLSTYLVVTPTNAESGPDGLSNTTGKVTAESIMSECTFKEGAHLMIMSCRSGLSEGTRATNEVLGLIPALFQAGSRSVLGGFWDLDTEATCSFVDFVRQEWEDEEEALREEGSDLKLLDMGRILKRAMKSQLFAEGPTNVQFWAGYCLYGYWMYPRLR